MTTTDRLLSDSEIANGYKDFMITEFVWHNHGTSGGFQMTLPFGEDRYENFIIYPDDSIGLDNWYPVEVHRIIRWFIRYKRLSWETSKIDSIMGVTISHGTFRSQDLLYAFIPIFDTVDVDKKYVTLKQNAFEAHKALLNDPDDNSLDAIAWDILFEVLDAFNKLAPKGYHFGPTESNSSDFGFWKVVQQ